MGGQIVLALCSSDFNGYLLEFFDTRTACVLREVCLSLCESVKNHRWRDINPKNAVRSLVAFALWSRSYPNAEAICWRGLSPIPNFGARSRVFNYVYLSGCRLTNDDLVHLAGIPTVVLRGCDLEAVTDAGFAHLRVNSQGIHTLDMGGCFCVNNITDAAFAHLRGIHTLVMGWYGHATCTDAAFAHLAGIHTLDLRDWGAAPITDAAFAHLQGIHTLRMKHDWQKEITDAAFAHLRGIHTLEIGGYADITDAAFAHLRGIHTL